MNSEHHLQPFYDAADGATFEEIGDQLRLSPGRVKQIRDEALVKMRVGLILIELLGRERAEPVLAGLQHATLSHWHRAMDLAAVEARRSRQ